MRPIDADAYEYPGDLINEPTLTLDDVVPHGRWKVNELGYIVCAHCAWVSYGIPLVEHYSYCPNCGAKMDLEEENA